MKRTLLAPLALLVAALPAAAQDATPKVSGLLQVWYTQMLSDNLRVDSLATTNGHSYYDLSGNWTENSFLIRRSEIHVSGNIPNIDGVSYELRAGDTLHFDSHKPHRRTNIGTETAIELWVGTMQLFAE